MTNLIVRRCRSYYVPLPGSDPGAPLNQYGYVPVSKYDIAQFVISFFHLGFIGFHFGLRMDHDPVGVRDEKASANLAG